MFSCTKPKEKNFSPKEIKRVLKRVVMKVTVGVSKVNKFYLPFFKTYVGIKERKWGIG